MANELEEHLDLGILYCGDVKHQQYVNHSGHFIVEMAEKLGFSILTIELARVSRETALTEIPMQLRNQTGQNSSFVIAPNSYQKQPSVAFYPWVVSVLHHLRFAIVRRLCHLRSAIGMSTKLGRRFFHVANRPTPRATAK